MKLEDRESLMRLWLLKARLLPREHGEIRFGGVIVVLLAFDDAGLQNRHVAGVSDT